SRAAVGDGTGDRAERVPDGRPPAVLGGGAFDLVGGRGRAPHESGREGVPARSGPGLFGNGHPLMAPDMIPPMICRPSRAKTTMIGTVASTVPVSTSA